ncbi:NlpC/P60 family protein [Paenibacillus sp. NPDC055715]
MKQLEIKLVLFQRDYFVRRRRVFNRVRLINQNKINYLPFSSVLEILEYDVLRSNRKDLSVTDGSQFLTIPIQGATARREGVSFEIDPFLIINKQRFISFPSINRLFNVDLVLNMKSKQVTVRQPGRFLITAKGDTLQLLARLLNTTVKRLLSVNKNLKEPITPGTKVTIPTIRFNNTLTSQASRKKKVKTKQNQELAPAIIALGRQLRGTPYRFGAGPYPRTRVFDCSSYIQYIFGRNGVVLPRTSRAQARAGRSINQNQIEAGDLIFFRRDRYSDNRIGHVGLDIGNGQMLNTYKSPPGVTITFWKDPYWLTRYVTAREIL